MKILDLYITDVCNLNCDYCYVDVVKKENTQFNQEEFTQRVDLLSFDAIKFLGGEPLVRWSDIKSIIESITLKKTDMNFTIITNGILLNEKIVSFIKSYDNVELLISLHDPSIVQIQKKRDMLLELKNNISLYIIFDPKSFSGSLVKFLEFSKYGFRNFCFAPEIYAKWTQKNLETLRKILFHLSPFITQHNISIGGVAKNSLKVMNYGCEKFIYDKLGEHKHCNRFRSLRQQEDFRYKNVYDYFQEKIAYKEDPNRWFYVCPVGWYLDNKNDLDEKIISYKELNTIFLDFHRNINGTDLNFLHPEIPEIRFNLTRQCNIRCDYCYVDFKSESLPFMEAKNIVDFIIEQPGEYKTFSFFGGEPLLEKKLLQKIVKYIYKKNEGFQKKISFKIATNFMLVDQEIISFFGEHDFEVHISLNGSSVLNNQMRDNSTALVVGNIRKYSEILGKENIIVLLAFSPSQIQLLPESISFMVSLGLSRINFELVFGDTIVWEVPEVKAAARNIMRMKIQKEITIENIREDRNTFLDIDTKGRCGDNSLEFYGKQVDSDSKKYFDSLLFELYKRC